MNKYDSISEKLSDEYKLEFNPGKKYDCPICNKHTLSIKKDDTFAKCFHPDCGAYWNLQSEKNQSSNKIIQPILLDLMGQFRYQLTSNKQNDAYKYLINRNLCDQMIEDCSYLGMVPEDNGWQVGIECDIEALEEDFGDNEKFKATIDEVKKLKEDLETALKNKAGWLIFAYTDANDNITQLKFRKPFSNVFTTFKIEGMPTGVFKPINGNVRTVRNLSNLGVMINEHNIVVEGEFNLLSLQSLLYKNGIKYTNCVAVGGVSTADIKTIRLLYNDIVIAYDNDDAGRSILEAAKKTGSFEAFTTPDADSDLDSYINSFEDKESALEAVLQLVESRKKHFKTFEDIRNGIKRVRNNERGVKSFELNIDVAQIILTEIADRSNFLYDENDCYLFLQEYNKLIILESRENEFKSLLISMGINPSEKLYAYVYEELVHLCRDKGKMVSVHRYAFYNKNQFTLYLYNGIYEIIKISKDKIEIVPNGTDDILFIYDREFEPFALSEEGTDKDSLYETLFKNINFNNATILEPDEQRVLLTLFFFSLFFETLMNTKPLLTMIGGKGSGKTSILRYIGILLFGRKFNVTSIPSKIDDLDTIVSNAYYCVLDNVDGYIEGLNDKLACYSTGQTTRKRKHYTNNEIYETTPRCYLSMTSRTPCFNRDDVADRMIPLHVDRLPMFLADSQLTEELLSKRNETMSFVVIKLQELINKLFETREEHLDTKLRMADFAIFSLKIAVNRDATTRIFDKLIKNQSIFTLDGDPLIDMLRLWLKNPTNRGRKVPGNILFSEFRFLADSLNIKDFTYTSTKALMKRLNNIKDNISEYIVFKKEAGHANLSFYTFDVTEKFLEFIDDEPI